MTQHTQNIEQEIHPDLITHPINPGEYIDTVISLYRRDEGDYRGRRNEDQQIIAEYAAEDADEYFDQAIFGIMALGSLLSPDKKPVGFVKPNISEEADITLGNFSDGASLRDMRNAWRQLWVGWNVLTNRLARDSDPFKDAGLKEVYEMDPDNKKLMIDALFGNFQDINALQFGADGSGLRRERWVNDPDTMEPVKVIVDRDKARSKKEIAQNAARRGYTAKHSNDALGAVHPAGKMTPEEYVQIRREYPEVDMDHFVHDAAFHKDIARRYHEQTDQVE